MTIFDLQKNMMSSFATPEMLAMAARPTAAVAATSAIMMGINSQFYGLMFGAVTGAMDATSKLAKHEFDAPVLPKKLPNPFTFEWSFDGAAAPAAAATSAAPAVKKPAPAKAAAPAKAKASAPKQSDVKSVAPKAIADQPVMETAPTTPVAASLMPEDFVKPKALAKPAKADDLKLISGVGPKLESVLNGLGIWTFAQIAAWTPAEVAWVDDFLQFKGRIDRDSWLAQAKTLAATA